MHWDPCTGMAAVTLQYTDAAAQVGHLIWPQIPPVPPADIWSVSVTFDPDNTRLTDTRLLGRFSHEHEGCCARRQVEYTTAYLFYSKIQLDLVRMVG